MQGTASRSQRQLERDLEDLGGQVSVNTSREHTVYSATVLKKDVSKALEVLADVVQNSSFDAAGVEQERAAILKEIAGRGVTEVQLASRPL